MAESGSIIDTLRDMLTAEPFVPFQITATNGKHYEVRDPQGVAIGQTQVSYYFPKSDRFAHIRTAEIVSIETVQAA
ncbi:MAG TPA: hypothetical protein VM008_00435 [Phycisphaerae bacterium]|nr:hypothetical protein [Phycisphaerae bacterium]